MLLKILTVNFVDLDSHPPKFRFHKLAELSRRKFIHSVIFLIFYFSVPHLPDNDLVLASSNNCSNINYLLSRVWSDPSPPRIAPDLAHHKNFNHDDDDNNTANFILIHNNNKQLWKRNDESRASRMKTNQ